MKSPQHNQPENDPTWDLLGEASNQTADPMFARNIMRSVRLESMDHTPWWKSLLKPAPALATLAAAACITFAAIALNPATPTGGESPITQTPNQAITPTTSSLVSTDYTASEDLDEIIDPLMLVTYTDETDAYSLEELGL